MHILLNSNIIGISYINIDRDRKIIKDRLFLKTNKESKKTVLEVLENIDGRLTVDIFNKAGIKLQLYEMRLVTDHILSEEDYTNPDGIMLYGTLINEDSITGEGYNQYIVNIFYDWSCELEFNWIDNRNKKIKESYLKACFIWNRGCYEMVCDSRIEMDGKLVRNEDDLFCYIGELFFGKRGFMGMGLDSFYDHLIDIKKHNKMSQFHLYISEVGNIESSVGGDYFLRFLEILRSAGINVYLDHLAS